MQPGPGPQWWPLKRQDSHVAEQMVERAAELARDSHARTRHAAVLVQDESMLAWGTNGVPYPGEDHCHCKFPEFGHHDQCRTHAEQRAITLAREGEGWRMLQGAKLIYVRLEPDDSVRRGTALLRALQPPGPIAGGGGMDLRPVRGPGRLLLG
jgi:deoxycytidylate deaminase